jgi:tetratricopeptide (TPR) repeat protein
MVRVDPLFTGLPGTNKAADTNAEILRIVAALPPEKVLEGDSEGTVPEDWPPKLSDAVKPIFTGDYKKAAEMLAALNAKRPDNYYICANLAVTSELSGNDAAALKWVEKAMRIKPDAHYKTEWMHAAVLRAKLALAKDPTWLDTHTISGIPLGDVPADFVLTQGKRRITLKEIQGALYAHVIPRLLLVKGQDRIVAAMLTELARIEARTISVESGTAMLALAAEHGATNTELIIKGWQALKK